MRHALALALVLIGCKGTKGPTTNADATPSVSAVAPSESAGVAEAPPTGTDAGAPEDPLRQVVMATVSASTQNLAKARANLAILQKDATKEELVLLERLGRLLDLIETIDLGDSASARGKMERAEEETLEVLRDWVRLTPDDVRARRMWIASLYALGQKKGEAPGTGRRKEALSSAKKLTVDFPNDGGSFGLYGGLCQSEDEELVLCARALARCQALEPDNAYCNQSYGDIVKQLTAERCVTVKPTLAFREAFTKPQLPSDVDRTKGKGVVRMVKESGEEVFVSPKVLLGSSDLARVEASEMTITEHEPVTVSDVNAVGTALAASMQETRATTRVLSGTKVVFAASKRAGFAKWVAEARSDRSTLLALVDGGALLLAARVGGIEDSVFLQEIPLARLCSKTVKPALPADLAPPKAAAP